MISVTSSRLAGSLAKAPAQQKTVRSRLSPGPTRRAESAALRTLANAARLLEDHPSPLRLHALQVAAEPGTRVVLDSRD